MNELAYALAAVFAVSAISFIGIFTLTFSQRVINGFLLIATALAAGTLLGAALFDLLPEASALTENVFVYALAGMLVFFIIERFIHWHHHHHQHHPREEKKIHPYVYLNLFGDGIHNFIDGALIAGSFLASRELGIVTAIAVIFHEIPQEISDFGLLIAGGLGKAKALLFNFASALTAVVGVLAAFFFAALFDGAQPFLLAFAAGGFIYIAAADLIPELHKQSGVAKSLIEFGSLIGGLAIIWIVGVYLPA